MSKHETRTDSQGRTIIGKSPDRTCLNCLIGFSLDAMNNDGSCPKCNMFRHVAALWNDDVIIPNKDELPQGDGLWKKLDSEYNKDRNFDMENFKKELADFFETPEIKKHFEETKEFMDLIHPYLHMTEAEMQEAIPNGMYKVGSGNLIAYTGKGGLIMTILSMQKELKKYTKI